MTHNLEPTLPRAIQALLFASLHLRELSDHSSYADSELEEWFARFAPHLGFAFSPTQSLLERFQAILMRIHFWTIKFKKQRTRFYTNPDLRERGNLKLTLL